MTDHDHSLSRIHQICAALPGAEMSFPFGEDTEVWKVGSKIFAARSLSTDGVSVKTRDIETASLIIEMGHGVHAPYFHKSWVHVGPGMVEEDELRERLLTSYDIIRASLTKKLQAELPARE